MKLNKKLLVLLAVFMLILSAGAVSAEDIVFIGGDGGDVQPNPGDGGDVQPNPTETGGDTTGDGADETGDSTVRTDDGADETGDG